MKKICNSTLVVMILCMRVSMCEIVSITPCPDGNDCEIHEIRIKPCAGAQDARPCAISRGKYAEIFCDFTPNFSTRKLKSMVYWVNGDVDHVLRGMNQDGCQYTFCPFTKGSRNSFRYPMVISHKLPRGRQHVECFIGDCLNVRCWLWFGFLPPTAFPPMYSMGCTWPADMVFAAHVNIRIPIGAVGLFLRVSLACAICCAFHKKKF